MPGISYFGDIRIVPRMEGVRMINDPMSIFALRSPVGVPEGAPIPASGPPVGGSGGCVLRPHSY